MVLNKFLTTLTVLFLLGTLTQPAYAGSASGTSECTTTYGNSGDCETINIIIDKKVADPETVDRKGKNPSNFQDNFGVNDNKYVPGQHIPYQIFITNSGTKTLTDITVKDILPQYVTLIASAGTTDDKNHTITMKIDKLLSGETKRFDILGQIVASDKLPSDQEIVCNVTNQATATVENKTEQDNAQVCIKKEAVGGEMTKGGLKVFPAPKTQTTPSTGPEALALIALLPSGIAGLLFRKKAK